MTDHVVSIITATIGRPSLQAACESVDRQTETRWHHYVLGDGRLITDYVHPNRTTLAFARPVGAEEPALDTPYGTAWPLYRWALQHLELGEYVCLLDDDNDYYPTYLEKMIGALSGSDAGIALCPLEDLRDADPHEGYPWRGHCDTSGFVARSAAARAVGIPHQPPDEYSTQDLHFIAACAERYGWIRVPEKLVRYGSHPATPPPLQRTAGWTYHNSANEEEVPAVGR